MKSTTPNMTNSYVKESDIPTTNVCDDNALFDVPVKVSSPNFLCHDNAVFDVKDEVSRTSFFCDNNAVCDDSQSINIKATVMMITFHIQIQVQWICGIRIYLNKFQL